VTPVRLAAQITSPFIYLQGRKDVITPVRGAENFLKVQPAPRAHRPPRPPMREQPPHTSERRAVCAAQRVSTPAGEREVIFFDDAFHDLLGDPDTPHVFGHVKRWLEARLR
jgi:alpha-beta hydrolase superfamily lysophospholipase